MSPWIRHAALVAGLGVFVPVSGAHAQQLLRFSASRNAAQRQQIKLPAVWAFCAEGGATQTVQLADGETRKTLDLVVVPAGRSADCGTGVQRVSTTVELLPPVLTVDDVKLADVALDWSSSAPEKLQVWVRSSLLVQDSVLLGKLRIKADGVNSQPAPDCDAGRDVCIFEVNGGKTWRERTAVHVEIESEGIVRAVLPAQPVYQAETGELLRQAMLPAYTVNRWASRDLQPMQRIVVTDTTLASEPLLQLPLQNDLFRFVRAQTRPCVEPTGQGAACAQVLNGPARLELSLTANKEALRSHLQQGKEIRVEELHLENVKLVKRSLDDEAPSLHTPTVVISRGECAYQLRQMHKVFAGTRSGRVYFDVDVPPGCLLPDGWGAASDDDKVRPGKTRRVGDRKLEVRLEELRGDEDFQTVLTFNRQDGATLKAQAVLAVERPVVLSVDRIQTCMSSSGGEPCQPQPYGAVVTQPESKPETAGGKGAGLSTQWPQERSVVEHLDVLGVGKKNLVRISGSSHAKMLFEIEGSSIRFCEGTPRQSKPMTMPAELCLEATKAEDALPKLRVRVAPSEEAAESIGLRPEEWAEIKRENGLVDPGWQSLTIAARPAEIRFAYPLRQRTYLACPNPKSGVPVNSLGRKGAYKYTFVPSHGGVRAVQMPRRRELNSCGSSVRRVGRTADQRPCAWIGHEVEGRAKPSAGKGTAVPAKTRGMNETGQRPAFPETRGSA